MRRVVAAGAALLFSIGAHFTGSHSAIAQGYSDDRDRDYYRYDRDRDRDYNRYGRRDDAPRSYDRPRGYGCEAVISATGVGYPFPAVSRRAAVRAWKRQAYAVYHRDFSWDLADEDKSIVCEPYLLVLRCTATARPCS